MWRIRYHALYWKYRSHTMVPRRVFVGNLRLVDRFSDRPGTVVECGVWRGGMSAAIAEVLGRDREYFLFDSFEGLPPAKQIDGPAARAWQQDTTSPTYFDNCRAEQTFAEGAMARSGAGQVNVVRGWFADTLRNYPRNKPIAILRLDGDWYDSTTDCLNALFPLVTRGGLVIIDDYFAWDGCARAVHDYLSRTGRACRLHESDAGICYLVNTGAEERAT